MAGKLSAEDRRAYHQQRTAELRELLQLSYGLMGQPRVWEAVVRAGGVHLDRGPMNAIAIAVQFPTATQVDSSKGWNKRGRTVIKGESHRIRIWAPRTRRTEAPSDGTSPAPAPAPEAGQVLQATRQPATGWLSQAIFDISQTQGADALPDRSAHRPAPVVRNRLVAELTSRGEHDAFLIGGIPAEAMDPEDAARALLVRYAAQLIAAEGHTDPEQIEAEAASAAHVAALVLGITPGPVIVPPTAGWITEDPNNPPIKASAVRVIKTGRAMAATIGDACPCSGLGSTGCHAPACP